MKNGFLAIFSTALNRLFRSVCTPNWVFFATAKLPVRPDMVWMPKIADEFQLAQVLR
jgi:hypothetical protein